MTDDQLRQIIIDAYEARPETKEYFDFFVNPDVDKLMDKFQTKLHKEFGRTKWGRSKARTTVIKRAVNDVVTLNPGPTVIINTLLYALSELALTDKYVELNDAQKKLGVKLLSQIIEQADKAQIFAETAPLIQNFLRDPRHRPSFMRYLADNIELTIPR